MRLFATTFPIYQSSYSPRPRTLTEFWWELGERLLYFHGLPSLSRVPNSDPGNEILSFVSGCKDEHFLDFIELIFQSELIWQALDPMTGNRVDVDTIVENINTFLEVDDLPYYLTGYAFGDSRIAHPQIIRRDSVVLHETAIEPVLTLLSHPDFTSANEEFLDALKDYRQGDYRDCVVKCGSAFESVMKVICDQNGWPVGRDAGKLLNAVLPKTALPGFLKQPLIQIATIRNELGSAHGAGHSPREVSKRLAQYTVNVTASAVLLLVEGANS